jgi:hypothetical protein
MHIEFLAYQVKNFLRTQNQMLSFKTCFSVHWSLPSRSVPAMVPEMWFMDSLQSSSTVACCSITVCTSLYTFLAILTNARLNLCVCVCVE